MFMHMITTHCDIDYATEEAILKYFLSLQCTTKILLSLQCTSATEVCKIKLVLPI